MWGYSPCDTSDVGMRLQSTTNWDKPLLGVKSMKCVEDELVKCTPISKELQIAVGNIPSCFGGTHLCLELGQQAQCPNDN